MDKKESLNPTKWDRKSGLTAQVQSSNARNSNPTIGIERAQPWHAQGTEHVPINRLTIGGADQFVPLRHARDSASKRKQRSM